VIDPEFAKLNDVTGFKLAGKESFKVDAQAGKLTASVAGAGSIQSTQLGEIPITVTGKMEGDQDRASGEIVITLKFPSYTVELKEVTTAEAQKVTKEYTLNGESINKEQAKQYLQSLETGEKN